MKCFLYLINDSFSFSYFIYDITIWLFTVIIISPKYNDSFEFKVIENIDSFSYVHVLAEFQLYK